MNGLQSLLSHPAVMRLGWALLHFLWQGAAVAALLALALLLLRRASANARYLAACVALLLMAAAPVLTYWHLTPSVATPQPALVELPELPDMAPSRNAAAPPATFDTVPPVVSPEPLPASLPLSPRPWHSRAMDWIEANLRRLVGAWFLGVLFLSIRLFVGWLGVRRIRRSGSAASETMRERLNHLVQRLRVTRPVRLLASAIAEAPVVIGWFRPVILFPASVLTHLSAEQLDAILVHELAHVRRHDYLVNLFQTVVETLLFYHPAVHWVSHRIRVEREHACDDLAVSACGDSTSYARALARLAEMSVVAPRLVPAAAGQLLARIRRLLSLDVCHKSRASVWVGGAVLLTLVLACAIGLGATKTVERKKAEEEPAAGRDTENPPDYSAMLELMGTGEGLRLPTPEEIKKLGPLWPTVTPEENAAFYFAKANKDLIEYCKQFPEPPGSLSTEAPYAGDAAGFARYIQNNHDVLATLREGLSKPDFQIPCLIFEQTGTAIPSTMLLAHIRNLARFLSDAGFAAELQGRPEAAAGQYLTCMRMGKMARNGSVLIAQLVGIALETIGARNLDALIANAVLDKAALSRIIALSRDAETSAEDRLGVLRREAQFARVTMAMSPRRAQVFGKEYEACMASVKKDLARPLPDILQSADDRVKELAEKYPSCRDVVLHFLVTLPQKWTRMDLEMRVLQIRAAIALYEKAHGAPPDALAALVPGFLPEVPEDPYSAKPLRYARTGDGWKLWSVGHDLKDDGGEASLVDQKGWIGPDFVYTNKVRSNIDKRSHGKITTLPTLPPSPQTSSVLQFRLVDDSPAKKGEPLKDVESGETLHIMPEVLLSEADIASASIEEQPRDGAYTLRLTLTADGRRKFAEITERNVGRRLAIVYEGAVLSAPLIRTRISGPVVMIQGSNSAQIKRLAELLNTRSSKAGATDQRDFRGQVIDHEGKAVPGVTVLLVGSRAVQVRDGKAADWAGPQTTTDDEGRFRFAAAGSSRAHLVVLCPQLHLWQVPLNRTAQEQIIQLPLPASMVISYDIEGASAEAEFALQLLTNKMPGWKGLVDSIQSPRCANKGQIALDNMTPGRYQILRIRDVYLKGWGRGYGCDRRYFTLESGQTTRVEFVRKTGQPIHGEVVKPKNAQIEGIFVLVKSPHATGDFRSDAKAKVTIFDAVRCDADGRFTTSRISPGSYTVVTEAYKPESVEERTRLYWRGATWIGITPVTVPESGTVQPVRIELKPRQDSARTFGPVTDAVIPVQGETVGMFFFDFERGRCLVPPAQMSARNESVRDAWMIEEGVDVLAEKLAMGPRLWGIGCSFIEVYVEEWEALAPSELVTRLKTGHLKGEAVTRSPSAMPAVFLFKTREGGMGILQILGFTDNPKAVKIRYKMIRREQPADAKPAAQPTGSMAPEELEITILLVEADAELRKRLGMKTPSSHFFFVPQDVSLSDNVRSKAVILARLGQTAKGRVGMYTGPEAKRGDRTARAYRELAFDITPKELSADGRLVLLQMDVQDTTRQAGGVEATRSLSTQIRVPFDATAAPGGLAWDEGKAGRLILISVRRVAGADSTEQPSSSAPEPAEEEEATPPKLLVETVMNFIAAANNGDVEAAKACYWPRNDPEKRAKEDVRDWAKLKKLNRGLAFRPAAILWSSGRALVVTNSCRGSRDDPERLKTIVMRFLRWSEGDDTHWGISTLGLESLDRGLEHEITLFLQRNPRGKHWYGDDEPAAEASQSIVEEIRSRRAQAKRDRKPTRLPLDGSTEFVGHHVTDFAAEIEKLKAEIAESAAPTEEGPQVVLQMRDIAIKAAGGEKAESPYEPMTVLSSEEYLALVERVKSTKSMTTVAVPHLILIPGKRKLLDLSIQCSYPSGYTVKDGFAIPVLEGYTKSGYCVDAEVIVDGDAVIFKRLRYKIVAADLRPCSATFSVGDEPESEAITVNVSEPIATTCTAILEKPEEVRLKVGETLVLPYSVSVERGFSNLRSILREDEFQELPGQADPPYDPNKTVRLVVVTASLLESTQSAPPNPPKGHDDSAPEPTEKKKDKQQPVAFEPPWGEPVKGVQVLFWPHKTRWTPGEMPAFFADVNNRGKRRLLIPHSQQLCELEFDGHWYRWADAIGADAIRRRIVPGAHLGDVKFLLDESWGRKRDGAPLKLGEGRHTVRVAFICPAADEGEPVRAESLLVEIEIRPENPPPPGEDNPERFREEMSLAEKATDRDSKIAHLRRALRFRPDHPDNIAIEYEMAVQIRSSVKNPRYEGGKLDEARVIYQGILNRYDHMHYYTQAGANSPWDAQVLVPEAALGVGLRHFAMECLKKTHERRTRDWLDAPEPKFDPNNLFHGGEMGRSKWESRVALWRKRKEDAAAGNVLSGVELLLARGIMGGIARRFEPEEAVAALRQIIGDFPDTPMARLAAEQIEEIVGRKSRMKEAMWPPNARAVGPVVEEGVVFGMWMDKLVWGAGETPVFMADLSHRGKRELSRWGTYELEIDGEWYVESWWEAKYRPDVFRPQTDYRNIRFVLDNRWRNKQFGKLLSLTPGRHLLRLAFYAEGSDKAANKLIRIESNVITFRLLGPGEEATEGEWFELAAGGRPGSRYSSEQVAAMHRAKYGQDLPPAELAKFYAKQAVELAQTAPDPAVLADIIERVLAFDQDDVIRLKLYIYLGDAYQRQTRKYTPEIWGRQRRIAAEAYLTGLRHVLRHDLPAEPSQFRGYPDGYILDGPPGMAVKYPTKQQRERASRRGTERIREFVQMRQVLTGQLVQMYAREPDASDELQRLMLKHIGSEEAAEQMIKAARAYRTNSRTSIPVIAALQRTDTRPAQDAEATPFMEVYDAERAAIEAGFIPDETSIILGQALFITFTVINRSEKPYRFRVGGDNRGSVRHNSFRITAVDEDGQTAKDPYSYRHFGGFGGTITLEPGQAYMERLYLGHWCVFEKPGLYIVTCKRTLTNNGREPKHPAVPVTTSFNLKIAPSDLEKMGKVIADLGKRVREGHEQAILEATLGLSVIRDERAIPHLALSLTKGDYCNRRPAIKGLSQFTSDAAADALVSALKDPDHAVRDAAGTALQKMGKIERALAPLLKELADETLQARALAARALGATKARQALMPLIEAMDDPDPIVRHGAATALGKLGYEEAIQPLRERLEDKDMAMSVAVVKGLRGLGESLDVEWLTPAIRAAADVSDRSFHEAIRLIRLYGGKNAARALVGCLQFDDPSVRNSYNMYLILAIEACAGGPKYYYQYHHDPNTDGTPQHIEENRKILRALKTWLKEHQKPVVTQPRTTPKATDEPTG